MDRKRKQQQNNEAFEPVREDQSLLRADMFSDPALIDLRAILLDVLKSS